MHRRPVLLLQELMSRPTAELSDRDMRRLDDLLEAIEAANTALLAARRRLWMWQSTLVSLGTPAAAIARARGVGRSVVTTELGRLARERSYDPELLDELLGGAS